MAELSSTSPVSSASSPTALDSTPSRQAPRMATMLDLLLVLAAVLVSTFRWSPIQSIPSIIILVAIVLLCLLLEEIVRVVAHRVAPIGWSGTLTKGDVLILLVALLIKTLSAGWIISLAVGGLILWSGLALLFWLRGQRVGADGWFHRAALLTSLVAIAVSVEMTTIWLTEDGLGGPPSPLTHGGFHVSLDGGIGISCILLVLILAWIPVRKGQSWGMLALLVALLPAAFTYALAAVVALVNGRVYGFADPAAWLLPVFWLLSVGSAIRGFLLKTRTSSAEAEPRNEVRGIGFFYGGLLCAAVVVNVTSEWLFLPLGMILFLVMLLLISEKRAQSRRISVEDWFGLPAALATCVAIETAGEPFNLWHFGLPWPLDLVGFHQFLDGGIEISAVVLLLVLAWIPMRKGQSWSFKAQPWALAAGLMAALPAAIVGGWAWSLAATHQRWYAAHHPFALLLAIFWVLTALLMVVEWVLLRHASTVGTAPEETHNHA